MPDERLQGDAAIIHTAYAEKIGEAFKVFAEALAVGQREENCLNQFKRSMLWARRARDLILEALNSGSVEPGVATAAAARAEPAAEPLSAEDQALIDQVLKGTTGHAAPPLQQQRYRGR